MGGLVIASRWCSLSEKRTHAEESRIDAIATEPIDMGTAPVSGQHAQENGAHDVDGPAAAIAGVVQRTAAEECIWLESHSRF
jgi:hypothetical protein